MISDRPSGDIAITLHLHNVLREQAPTDLPSPVTLALPASATVADLLARLGLTFPPDALLLVVNRRAVGPEHTLRDGDTVHLIPALAGG